MSNVGIPIKLLYEAEGMKVTVEVSDYCQVFTRRGFIAVHDMLCMSCAISK